MAGETTITTLTEIVNSEWIEPMIMDYARDVLVIGELARLVDIRGKSTKVVAFPIWEEDAAEDITTEGVTTLTAKDLTLAETTVTVAQIGILREPTKFAERVNMLGEAGLVEYIAKDSGFQCGKMAEDDLAALFGSVTASVGTSGSDLTVSNMLEALGKRRTANARGIPVFVLDDQQTVDLQTDIGSTTATLFTAGANQSVMNADSSGTLGTFLNAEVRYTNLTDTANGGADVCGALLNTGVTESSLGIVLLWAPEMDKELDVAKSSRLYAVNMAYGVGLINDGGTVKLVTDA
jgi:hypothetical protein